QCDGWPDGSNIHLGDISRQYKCPTGLLQNSGVRVPCTVAWPSAADRYVQYPLYRRNDDGRNVRITTSFLGRPNTYDGLWNSRELPDASWVLTIMQMNGIRNEILMAKLGAMQPNDGVNRMDFIPT